MTDPDRDRREDAREFGKKVGHQLLGTCKGLYEVEGAEDMQDDGDFCAGLDDVAMTCDGCGWWFEPHELNERQECKDCGEPDDEN